MERFFEFFRKQSMMYGEKKSSFDLWVARNIICKFFGHRWEYWAFIGRDKCSRCLESGELVERGSLTRTEMIRSRVRMPDGKVLSGRQGMKVLDERRKAQEKWS